MKSVKNIKQLIKKFHVTTNAKMDQKVPGDNPQKWGQYNLIGQVFSAVERELKSTSLWPVIRDNVYSLALAQNALVATARDQAGAKPPFVAAYAKTDGKVLWKVELPTEPRRGGLAIDRGGRIVVTLGDGSIVCVGN